MRVVVVVAHPDPSSFTHAIASTATTSLKRTGHQVTVLDLYAEEVRTAMSLGERPPRRQTPTDPRPEGRAACRDRQTGRGARLRLPDLVEHGSGNPQGLA